MNDMGDAIREYKRLDRAIREKFGVDCPECNIKQPKRTPTILLPGQRCKFCGYRDHRPEIVFGQQKGHAMKDRDRIIAEAVEYAKPPWGQTMLVVYEPGRGMKWRYQAIDELRYEGAIPGANAEAIATAAIEAKIVEMGAGLRVTHFREDSNTNPVEVKLFGLLTRDASSRNIEVIDKRWHGAYTDKPYLLSQALCWLVDQIGEHQ